DSRLSIDGVTGEHDAIAIASTFSGNVAESDVGAHQLGIALQRIAVSSAARRSHYGHVVLTHGMTGDFSRRVEIGDLVASADRQVIGFSAGTAADAPGRDHGAITEDRI